jgi:hypothetical protein
MPGDAVLTGASTITCGHPGSPPADSGVITPVPSTRLTVAGQGVLTVPAGPTLPVSGCLQPTNPSGTTGPCLTVTIAATGAAASLRVDGVPVLLATTLTATTNGLPPGKSPAAAAAIPPAVPMVVLAKQTLLTAR